MSPVAAATITVVLLLATLTDLRSRVVPNGLMLGAAVAGLVLAATEGPPQLASAVLAGLTLSAPLMALALVKPDGIGMGDVKMVAVLGLLMGWQALAALLAGCLLAGMTGVLVSLGSRRPPSQVMLPLVPFLALGALPVVAGSLSLLQ